MIQNVMAAPCFCRAFLLPKTKGPFSDLRTALGLLFSRMARQIQRVVLVNIALYHVPLYIAKSHKVSHVRLIDVFLQVFCQLYNT